MELEEYKMRIEDWMLNTRHFSKEVVDELMAGYAPALQAYLDEGWEVETMGAAMANNF